MEVWGPWPLWLSNVFILIWKPRETLVLKSRAISFQLNSQWIQHSMQIKLCPFKPKAKKPSSFYVSEFPKYIYLFGGNYSDLWYHCQFHYQIMNRHKWVIVLQIHSHLTNGLVVFAQGIVWFVIENIKNADYARYADYRAKHWESQECIPVGCVPPACWPYPSMHCGAVYLPSGGVPAEGGTCLGACTCPGACTCLGVYLPGGYLPRYSSTCEQNDCQTGVKT